MGISERDSATSQLNLQSESSPMHFGEEIDLSPETHTNKLPILFVPGWNAKLADYKEAIDAIVAAGNRVMSFIPTGTEAEKARKLIDYLKAKGLKKANIIAHSVGAICSELAGLEEPDLIQRLVLLNPPTDEKNSRDLIGKYKAMLSLEGAKSAMDVGGRKIVEMSKVITSFDMGGMRRCLNRFETKAISIHGLHDILFPPPPTALEMDEANIKCGHDEFYVEGNHLGITSFIPPALRLLDA